MSLDTETTKKRRKSEEEIFQQAALQPDAVVVDVDAFNNAVKILDETYKDCRVPYIDRIATREQRFKEFHQGSTRAQANMTKRLAELAKLLSKK